MRPIRLAVIQNRPKPGYPKYNAEHICRMLRDSAKAGADLALFPECALTGYRLQRVRELALQKNAPVLERIRRQADADHIGICFGYMQAHEDHVLLTQELHFAGESVFYHKTHLGFRERELFHSGNAFPVLDAPICCGIQLCWESHIPDIACRLRKQGAELLLVPYASPMSGGRCRDNWNVHLPARASDNGVFLAACNLLFPSGDEGGDPSTGISHKGGGMVVYDPKGRPIAEYFGSEENTILCDLAGPLPREIPDGDMHNISYFDRRRADLFD